MDYGKSTLGVCRKNKLYLYKEIEAWMGDETEKIGVAVAGVFAVVENEISHSINAAETYGTRALMRWQDTCLPF